MKLRLSHRDVSVHDRRSPDSDLAVGDPALAGAPFDLLLAERLLMHRIVTACIRNGDVKAANAAKRCIEALAAEMDRRDCGS